MNQQEPEPPEPTIPHPDSHAPYNEGDSEDDIGYKSVEHNKCYYNRNYTDEDCSNKTKGLSDKGEEAEWRR